MKQRLCERQPFNRKLRHSSTGTLHLYFNTLTASFTGFNWKVCTIMSSNFTAVQVISYETMNTSSLQTIDTWCPKFICCRMRGHTPCYGFATRCWGAIIYISSPFSKILHPPGRQSSSSPTTLWILTTPLYTLNSPRSWTLSLLGP